MTQDPASADSTESEDRRRKVLAIDGGGIRGVIPASFLRTVETTLGVSAADYFDLIVGTSTGGIIALGLGIGLSAEEIARFYEEFGPSIFSGPSSFRKLRQIVASKYDDRALRGALETVFGEAQLGRSKTRLVVPSVNLDSGEVHIFKTAHHPRFYMDYTERVVDVALATAAAPTFFPTFVSQSGVPLLDGGLFVNNPSGLAAVEAIGVLGWDASDVEILSLGCGNEPVAAGASRRRHAGVAGWLFHATTVMLKAQSSYALGTAALLVGHESVVRIDPAVATGRFKLDASRELKSLAGLGASEARTAMEQIRARFFTNRALEFVPYRSLAS